MRPDGKHVYFSKENGRWVSDPDITGSLEQTENGWVYTEGATDLETYDTSGRLISFYQGDQEIVLAYAPFGLLERVSDRFGRSLTFTYHNGRLIAMTDPAGKHYLYRYGVNGNLTQVERPDGKTLQYLYESAHHPHALTGIVDENGNRFATWAYDDQGRAILSEHAGGAERVNLTYNVDGTTTVRDALGASRTYSFKTQHGVVKPVEIAGDKCTTCAGQAQAYTYDLNGFLTSQTNWNGNITTYLNDDRGLEISRTEAAGTSAERTITTDWHFDLRLPERVTEPGKETEYVYDERGNKLSETRTDTATGAARTASYSYNAQGLLTNIDGPRLDVLDVTAYEYDGQGNVIRTTNALGQVTEITAYDAHGRPLRVVDSNGVTTTLTHDPSGRLMSRTTAGEVTRFEYDGPGNLIKLSLPDGSLLSYTYDAAQRLTQIRDQLGNRIVYTLDAMGNRTKERIFDPAGALAQTRSRAFNALSRLVREAGASNQTSSYAYDGNGNPMTITDPLGRVTRNAYDPLNRLAQVTDPAGGITDYAYDASDNLVQVTDPHGLITRYSYDGLDNLTQTDSPDTGPTTHIYDLAGNLESETDARGQTQNYTYDALNRVISITNPTRSFEYDQGINATGRLTRITDPAGITEWAYNGKGSVAQKSQTTGALTQKIRYAHNPKGELVAITYPSGKIVRYGYDQLGRIGSITVDGAALINNVQYEPFGPVSGWTWNNGSLHRRDFNLDGQLISQDFGTITRTLTYDTAGRITSLSHSGVAMQDWTLRYDALDRLSGFTGRVTSQTYRYDPNGNRTSLVNGTTTYAYTYPAGRNQLSSIGGVTPETFTYDAVGSLTNEADRTYSYDGRRRLTQVTYNGGANSYQYNALGQRLSKSGTGSGVIRFVYDEAGHLIGEYNGSGAPLRETVYLVDMPVALLQPTAVRYIYTDHLNTPRVITDIANKFLWRWDSNPFGSALPSEDFDGNGVKFVYNLRFPGQYYDKETGLHHNTFREYDPTVARYIQSDPVGVVGLLSSVADASSFDPTQLLTLALLKQDFPNVNQYGDKPLNVYTYVANNPLSFIDPLGLDRFDICGQFGHFGGTTCKACVKTACSFAPVYCCEVDKKNCQGETGGDPVGLGSCEAQYIGCITKVAKKDTGRKPGDI